MLVKHRHYLPHWTLEGSCYIISFRLITGTFNEEEISIILENAKSGHNKFYQLIAAQVMPDHVHLILKPIGEYTPQRIVKGMKGVTARKINQLRNKRGSIWMVDYYDRILRTQSDLDEKLRYIFENPLRAGLVEYPEDYVGWYFQE